MTTLPVTQTDTDQLRARIEKVRQIVAPDLDEQELVFFLEYCKRTGLDPVTRQIYAQKRRSKNAKGEWDAKLTIGTSIDGQRLIAQRTGQYAGQVGPLWCGSDKKWTDVWIESDPPQAAKVGVLRHDFKEPVYGVATLESYCQRTKEGDPTSMWRKMPDVMLAKCAEALALRKAFPNELSGIYEETEMQQADSHAIPVASRQVAQPRVEQKGPEASQSSVASPSRKAAAPPDTSPPQESGLKPSDADIAMLEEQTKKHAWKNAQVIDFIRLKWAKASPRTLDLTQFQALVDTIQKRTFPQAMTDAGSKEHAPKAAQLPYSDKFDKEDAGLTQ